MNAPIHPSRFNRERQSNIKRRSIDERWQIYELLKSQLTASARTPEEYDVAVHEAAYRAGV